MGRPNVDTLTQEERSRRMSGIRYRGNRSTEWRFRAALVSAGIRGWKMHVRSVPGIPDFFFPTLNLAVFVDGCFWHGCRRCARRTPRKNRAYWAPKLRANVQRARRLRRQLRRDGCGVLRIWEHELRSGPPLRTLLPRLSMSPCSCPSLPPRVVG